MDVTGARLAYAISRPVTQIVTIPYVVVCKVCSILEDNMPEVFVSHMDIMGVA